MTFTTFVIWIHLAAIAVWVGGLFAVSFVFAPALRNGVDSPAESARLVALVVRRFQRISLEVIFLILLTGIFNVINVGIARGFNFSSGYITALATKAGLFVVVVGVQAWQSYRLIPSIAATTPGERRAGQLQRQALITSLFNLALAVTVILLGLELRHR